MNKIFFDSVSLSFNRRVIFQNLTLEFPAGKIFGVTGKNGSGKSTLLKLAAKIIKPDAGEVKIFGAQTVAAVTPELKIYDELTAAENLKFFASLRGKIANPAELGERVGLDFKTEIRAGNFSTGMRQRLKFAILLGVDADVWILDEPTSNLDSDGREKFLREIGRGAEGGKIIFLATNDAASAGISGTFEDEAAAGTLSTLKIYAARQAVLFGKMAFVLASLAALTAFLLPVFLILFDAAVARIGIFLAAVFLGLAGIAAAGTLTAALTVSASILYDFLD